MNYERQLLCTFCSAASFKNAIEDIKNFYSVCNNKFFVFSNVNAPTEIFLTYNISCEDREFPKFPGTISIHRKKQTNTLYTLNSMNQLIKDENNGVLDKSFSINWELYKNSFIITGNPSIRVIPIKLLEIINN